MRSPIALGCKVRETAASRAERMAVDGDDYVAKGEVIDGPNDCGEIQYWYVRWENGYRQHVWADTIERVGA